MIVSAAAFLTLLSIVGLAFFGQFGVLITFFSKPIVDATWDSSLGGVNLLQILGVIFPVLIIAKSFGRERSVLQMPLAPMWIIYFGYFLFAFSGRALDHSIFGWLDLTLRTLNGIAGYYVLQAYFGHPERFKKLLKVLILAGIFPMAVGVYQIFTGEVWRYDVTVGLIRNVGMYHDAVAIRMFAFQTLTAIVLYLSYFGAHRSFLFNRVFLVLFALVTVLVLYRVYSKAATLILLLWFIIWTISFKRILPTIFLVIVGLGVSALYSDEIVKDIAQLFSKELKVAESTAVDSWTFRRTLGGRVFSWYDALEDFSQRSLLAQVFGDGNPANIHNDFLAKLLSGGIAGLIIYLALLFAIGKRLIGNWRRRRNALDVMGLMVFVMVLVDSMGIHVTLYTSYQWFAWGMIGLALRGIEPESRKSAAANAPARGFLQRRWQAT